MDYRAYRFDGDHRYRQDSVKSDDRRAVDNKKKGRERLLENRTAISDLQNALFAEGKQSLLVIFQAMDAAGKDGTIRHIFTGVNPQGVVVTSFKQPSELELSRDYLWRVHMAVPRRGYIGIFNRSHYEDVLVGKVLDLPKTQLLPDHARKDIWEKRYRQIRDFERMLHENGTAILKFYLHLSREEQAERFLARAEDKTKNWKFSQGDLATSEYWEEYMHAYEDAINETASQHAPWFVVPADRKWYTRAVVSQIILDTLRHMDPQYPKASKQQRQAMETYQEAQEGEAAGEESGAEAEKE